MKNIPIGISLTFIAIALCIFINTKSDMMMLIAGILLGLGVGYFFLLTESNEIEPNS